MRVPIGRSSRYYPAPKPTHLVLRVADREALVCTGAAAESVQEVPFDQALQSIVCGDCRRKWQKIMKLPPVDEGAGPRRQYGEVSTVAGEVPPDTPVNDP